MIEYINMKLTKPTEDNFKKSNQRHKGEQGCSVIKCNRGLKILGKPM